MNNDLLVERVAKAIAPVRHQWLQTFGYKKPRVLAVDQQLAKAAIEASDIESLTVEVEEARESITSLRASLNWCVQNSGECLGDHPDRLKRFHALIDETM